MLSLINEESLISRGTIGQSIDAILSNSNGINKKLEIIIINISETETIRTAASIIYAFKNQEESIPFLSKFNEDQLWSASQITKSLIEYQYFNPYQ